MDARGYRKVDANPDLLVTFNANVKEQAEDESMPGPGVGYDGYRGSLYGGSQVETVQYKVGTRQHRRGRCQQAQSGVGRAGRGRVE